MPAPYSDNLYSVLALDDGDDGDDGDDYYNNQTTDTEQEDVFSPADGYFHTSSSDAASSSQPQPDTDAPHHRYPNVPVVPNVLVEDPTLREQDAGAKAREAEEERRLNDAGPGYQTFGPAAGAPQPAVMAVPEEQQALLPREPESMGGTTPGEQRGSWWRRRFRESWAPPGASMRRKVQTILGTLLVLSILAMLIGGFTTKPHDRGGWSNHSTGDKAPNPIRKPGLSPGSDLEWTDLSRCANSPHRFPKITSPVDFYPGRNLSITEKTDYDDDDDDDDAPSSGRLLHVSGDVVLRPTDGSSPGKVDLEVITNDENLRVVADWDPELQVFKVMVPGKVDWHQGELGPCIQMRITVWVPPGAMLDLFDSQITHLDINVLEDVALSVDNRIFLTSVVGDISAPKAGAGAPPYHLASRELYLQTVSGQISGWFPMHDLLHVSTASGDVSADVAPKVVYDRKVEPAVLNVMTVSGDVAIREPLDAVGSKVVGSRLPARDYVVKMESASGDIVADLAVSSSAKFTSNSGGVNVKLLPVLDSETLGLAGASEPSIATETKSGVIKVNLLEPRWTKLQGPSDEEDGTVQTAGVSDSDSNPTPPLSSLTSRHASISGDITLRYPSSWTGRLQAQTLSGSQRFRGEGLRTYRQGGKFPRILRGSKGDGKSFLQVDTISGEQDFLVGEA